ncbi:MAG TPA: ECF transporter S component [Spirochaetia bacterium]|nr:ECF transporter S component [Spirochaetia bacterium]
MEKRKSWKLGEIVTVLVLAVALGVLWWGWTFVYNLAKPLQPFGLDYLFSGFWYIGGTLIPFLIRRPGAAIFGELAAAIVEMPFTQWGLTSPIWGLVQGIACELVFLLFRYRKWDLGVLMLAGAVAAVFEYVLDFFYSHYAGLKLWVIADQLVSNIIGGAILAGVLAYVVGTAIRKTGVMRSITPGGQTEGA